MQTNGTHWTGRIFFTLREIRSRNTAQTVSSLFCVVKMIYIDGEEEEIVVISYLLA